MDRSPTIGEIGLDRRFVTDTTQYGPQREVFAALLEHGQRTKESWSMSTASEQSKSTLDMLQSNGTDRAIIHWYSGPLEVLSGMIGAGYHFTVGVEVLHSEHIRKVASLIPDGQLLTETDNPGGREWLTGEAGRPSHIEEVVDELARVRGVTSAELMGIDPGESERSPEWRRASGRLEIRVRTPPRSTDRLPR